MSQTFYMVCSLLLIAGCSREPSQGGVDGPLHKEIRNVPTQLMNFSIDRAEYIKQICGRVAGIHDRQLRIRQFEALQDCAFGIRFEEIGDVGTQDLMERKRVYSRLGLAHTSLETFSKEVFWQLVNSRASTKDAFRPLFRFYEKMRVESLRIGSNARGYPEDLLYIERMYGALLKSRSYKPEDFEWVKAEFQRIAGRPILTLEEASEALKAAPPTVPSR